jgi:hypothetical protein
MFVHGTCIDETLLVFEPHTGADDSWQSCVAGDTQLFLKHDPLTMGWRVGDHVGLLVSKECMLFG